MSTTLPVAILYLNAKIMHRIVFSGFSFIIKALGEKGCGWIKKL